MNAKILAAAYGAGLFVLATGCITSPRGFPATNGIQNFDRVSPKLMRGAQPNNVGLAFLKKQGVVKVVNLRQPNDIWPEEGAACTNLGIQYINIPLPGFWSPTKADVEKFLAEVQNANGPVFVHCQYGCDRTGTMAACARIRFEGWPNQKALQEAEIYGMSPLEGKMKEFILHFK